MDPQAHTALARYPINSENFERCYSPRGVRCEDSWGCRAALAAFLRGWGMLLMKPCLSEIQARTEAVFTTFLLSVPAPMGLGIICGCFLHALAELGSDDSDQKAL